MSQRYNAIVIGTGQAGPALAARLDTAGLATAVIERKAFGGTCVNYGCIPTKALVASARAAHMARRAGDFGVAVDGAVSVDLRRVKARKDEIVRASTEGVEKWMRGLEHGTVYQGHARFVAPGAVEVDGERLEAERIFVNTGARPVVPPFPGLEDVPWLTNSTIMELETLPEHLIVVGGSYIGLEFAQMFRRFGSRVSVIEMADRVLPADDTDVSHALSEILRKEGLDLLCQTKVTEVLPHEQGVCVRAEGPAGAREVVGSHLLVAVGRRPNTDDLGLETAGIETDGKGFIRVDDQLRTSAPGVWALGDCNGQGAFTHTAYNDYEIVAANLLDNDPRRLSDRIPASAVYVDPPLGRAGMSEREVREQGRDALIATMPMSRVGRARERSETDGFMKVLVDAESERILGATILGINGDEAIHTFLDVMYAEAPYTVLQRAMHIHPTVCELLPTLLGRLESLR